MGDRPQPTRRRCVQGFALNAGGAVYIQTTVGPAITLSLKKDAATGLKMAYTPPLISPCAAIPHPDGRAKRLPTRPTTTNPAYFSSLLFRQYCRRQMSFVEIYNEQLFDLLLSSPEALPSSRNQQQRRFNVYGGNGSESSLDGKRSTPFSSVQKLTMDVPGSGGGSDLHTPPAAAAGTPQHAAELAIYERPDGSTYVKASRALQYVFAGAGGGGRASVLTVQ